MNRMQRVLRVVTGAAQAMNMMHRLRRSCLLFVAIATAAFAAPGFAKNFYAELLDAANQPTLTVPNGTGITIKLKVYNTSTEPATINSLVLCNLPGVTLTGVVPGTGSGTLGNYAPVGNEPDQCAGAGGKTLTDFTGIRRNNNKTFHIVATINATCSNPTTWPIFASTGNTFSSITKFTNDEPTQAAFGCDAVLSSCTPPSSYTEVSGSNTTTIQRLEKPGFPCDPTSFTVLFTDSDNTVEVQWTGQVLLKATTVWPLSLVDPQTTQHKKTWVAWEKDGSNNWILIPVPYCTSDQAPTTAPITDPFPVINSTAVMPGPGGTTLIPNPYIGQRARICAIAERNVVVDPNAPPVGFTCPLQPSGLDADVVLGCVYRETILYIRDDIIWANR